MNQRQYKKKTILLNVNHDNIISFDMINILQ